VTKFRNKDKQLIQQLFLIGLGYSATAYIEAYGGHFGRLCGTVRSTAKQNALAATGISGRPVVSFVFDGEPSDELTHAMGNSSCLLVSAPPAATAFTALAAFRAAGAKSSAALSVVYLSSLSVYGDYGGAEIDESAPLHPTTARGRERFAAEEAWMEFGRATGCSVAIFRLAGIYGPGRNALITVAKGQAKRITKPGQVFNRIHVADIAQSIHAAFESRANGAFNIVDDEPAPPQDVIAYAAKLLGQLSPPEISYEDAKPCMSPIAQSFYVENKRASNRKIKSKLGLTLRYPNYRSGLEALFATRDHERNDS
jgi:nucleoside-diphosphate-sugar epimerase